VAQSTTRAVRLMHIRDLLSEDPYSVQQLAELCDVSEDTIYRDLIDLQLEPLCLPLVVDGGKWRVFSWRRELAD